MQALRDLQSIKAHLNDHELDTPCLPANKIREYWGKYMSIPSALELVAGSSGASRQRGHPAEQSMRAVRLAQPASRCLAAMRAQGSMAARHSLLRTSGNSECSQQQVVQILQPPSSFSSVEDASPRTRHPLLDNVEELADSSVVRDPTRPGAESGGLGVIRPEGGRAAEVLSPLARGAVQGNARGHALSSTAATEAAGDSQGATASKTRSSAAALGIADIFKGVCGIADIDVETGRQPPSRVPAPLRRPCTSLHQRGAD
jgi:hypothetical protein